MTDTTTMDEQQLVHDILESERHLRREMEIHQPIFIELTRLALPIVHHYHAYLGHDALFMARQPVGTTMVWGARDCGTHIFCVQRGTVREIVRLMQTCARFESTTDWYLIKITGKRWEQYADGTVIKLDKADYARDLDKRLTR